MTSENARKIIANVGYTDLLCVNCGIHFLVENEYDEIKRKTSGLFFCPNGHSLSYPPITKVANTTTQVTEPPKDTVPKSTLPNKPNKKNLRLLFRSK